MHPYIGSGPYCYSNSLAMILGADAPSLATIEVLTGSPFGMQLLAGRLPLFDPYGWDPDLGLDAAIERLGWACDRSGADNDDEAIAMLRVAVKSGPVLAGPVEMGLLLYHPGLGQPIEADHFVVVLDVDDDRVVLHDPQGFPYATLATAQFLRAWRADSIGYKTAQYTMRSAFRRVRQVDELDALRDLLPAAKAWLSTRDDLAVPPGTLGGRAAAERFAEILDEGADPATVGLLNHFAIRVGARRLADGASALTRLGVTHAAALMDLQARLVGGLQYELVAGSTQKAAAALRKLAPTYAKLADMLPSS